jgi:hypothetical protein
VGQQVKKGLNSLIILGAQSLWRYRNNCVFNGASPLLASVLNMARDEAWNWTMGGTKGIPLVASQTTLGGIDVQ